ncbi:MAG: histidine phosphatase family protein [Caldilineaceae bacterium]
MKLFLIRHAQSTNNALAENPVNLEEYTASREAEPPLTEIGLRQAQLLADYLAATQASDGTQDPKPHVDEGYSFTQLYCSPMLRTLQTAWPISQAMGLQPEVWIDIHEHGGIFSGDPKTDSVVMAYGLTRQQMAEQFPRYRLPETLATRGWWRGGYEEMEECYARAQRVADTLRTWAPERSEARIAFVSHGTFLDALIKALLGHDFASQLYYTHYNTAITRIDFTPRGFLLLRYLNRIEHLPATLITR